MMLCRNVKVAFDGCRGRSLNSKVQDRLIDLDLGFQHGSKDPKYNNTHLVKRATHALTVEEFMQIHRTNNPSATNVKAHYGKPHNPGNDYEDGEM